MSKIGRTVLLACAGLWVAAVGLSLHVEVQQPAFAAGAEQEKLSAFAPLGDLVEEFDDLMAKNEPALADEKTYKEQSKRVAQDAYTLAIIAHALAQHDKKDEAKWSANALEVRTAAIALAQAKSFGEAQASHKRIKELLAGGKANGQAPELAWHEIAPLKEVMFNVNKRYTPMGISLRRKRAVPPRQATMVALLARVAHDDHHEVKKQEDVVKWEKYADELRGHCAELAQSLRENNGAEATKVFKVAQAACNQCHKDFRPDIEP